MSKTSRSLLPWAICGLAAVFYCYEYLLRVAPSVMVPELMQTFQVSAATLGVLSSFYYYAYTPMQLPVGMMMDLFGPRKILTLAVFSCACGAFVFAISDSFWYAAFGRFLMGFGSAFAFVGVLKLASIWLPANRFAFIAGLATTLGMVGAISGELILSHLVGEVGWNQTIIYSSVCGFILLPMVWFVIRDNKPGEEGATTSRIRINDFIQEIWFVVSNPQVWLVGLVGGLMFLPLSVFAELWGNEYLKSFYGMSVQQATYGSSLIFAGWAIGGPFAGAWSDRIGSRKLPLLLGSLLACISLSVLMLSEDLPISYAYLCLFMTGFFGGAQVIVFAVGRENCQTNMAGTSAATVNFLIMLVGAVLQPLAGKIIDLTWTGEIIHGQHVYGPESYQLAMIMVPGGVILAFMLTLFLKETACQQQ